MPKTLIIRDGDSLANIAYEHGLLVQTLWMHPDNDALRAKRPDMNVLMPGDQLVIPDKRPSTAELATDQRHRFRLKDVPHVFRLQLFDDELPRERQNYDLTVKGKGFVKQLKGSTDGDGVLTAYIPPGSLTGRLSIAEADDQEPLELDIMFGSLDPVEELSGVQKRLANLGFDCPVDGLESAATRLAVEAFQRRFSLTVSGEIDAATRQALSAMNEEVRDFPDDVPEPIE